MKKLLILQVLAIAIGIFLLRPSQTPQEPVLATESVQVPEPGQKPIEEPLNAQTILELVNAERAKVGVKPLVMDERLNQSAQRKADEMFSQNHYSHQNLAGVSGYTYIGEVMQECKIGSENLLALPNTSQQAVKDWMNSPTHRDALLNADFDYTGIASKTTYTVQHFCDVD